MVINHLLNTLFPMSAAVPSSPPPGPFHPRSIRFRPAETPIDANRGSPGVLPDMLADSVFGAICRFAVRDSF